MKTKKDEKTINDNFIWIFNRLNALEEKVSVLQSSSAKDLNSIHALEEKVEKLEDVQEAMVFCKCTKGNYIDSHGYCGMCGKPPKPIKPQEELREEKVNIDIEILRSIIIKILRTKMDWGSACHLTDEILSLIQEGK